MRTLLTFFVFLPFLSFAQVGVNTTTPNAALDIQSSNNGVLIPRVRLTDALDIVTVVNPAGGALTNSTLVYNLAPSGAAPNDVIAGFYYWNGSQWVSISGSAISDHDWYEVGTTTAPNAISDNMFHTGKVAIGTSTPQTNAVFQVEFGTNNTDGVIFAGTQNVAATVPNLGAGSRMMFFPGKSAFRAGTITGTEWDNSSVGQYSVAMGRNSIASGLGSSAFGSSYATALNSTALNSSISTGSHSLSSGIATANGDYSLATGFATANGNYSTSGGNLSIADGTSSFAMGEGNQANGDYSVAMGRNSIASGLGSSAFGSSDATGLYSTALNSSISNGSHSLSFGRGTANGDHSTSGGFLSVADGNSSFAIGQNVTAQSYGETSLGVFNRPYTMSALGETTFDANDHLFNLGNGNAGSPHNALTVFKDGRININEEYTLPNIDGTASQILQTDGTGNVTWQDPTSFGWELDGNAAITTPVSPTTYGTSTIAPTENFIGTTDANDFTIGTNNIERMRVKSTTGNIGIGTANPFQPFHVYKNFNASKSTILGEAIQTSILTDYQNRGIEGYGSGTAASGGYGYGIGVMGIGDRVNSYYATGVFGYLGTTSPNAPATNQALLGNGNNIGNAAILTNGNVGIGIPLGTNPTNQLHVYSAANGAIRIEDGTQGNKKVLTSDATGVGTWQQVGIENIQANLSSVTGISISFADTANFLQTGASITLPPGRYAVNVTMLLSTVPGAYTNSNEAFWVRSSFSDSAGPLPLQSGDIIGSNLVSGNLVPSTLYSLITGMLVINNSTAGNKTYHYIAGRVVTNNSTRSIAFFGGSYWAENNIIAYRLN